MNGRDDANETPLSQLFAQMRSAKPAVAEAAWADVYRRYHERVWGRVFYVIRTIPWLREPREVASDVTTEVFIGLPAAVSRYEDMGRAEQWLLRVALRVALRHKEKLTGNWSEGRSSAGASSAARQRTGRSYFDLDDAVEHISSLMYEVELDERLDLQRRLDAWRTDPGKARWLEFIELFLEGYSHDEIAERLGITSGTSRTWLWKIRQQLAQPADAAEMDEVGGRGGGEDPFIVPIRPGAGSHLDEEQLERFADGLFEAEAYADAAAHVEGCALCGERISTLRRGLAVLALGSSPPADMAQRIAAARANGTRPLLPVEPGDAGEPLLDEVVGRDATPEDDEPGEPGT